MSNSELFVKHLTWHDYLVLFIMLAISSGIGFFYGCFGSKMNNTKDYLLAGKSVGTLPVSASLAVSFISAIMILGGPSEIYQNGFVYWLSIFATYLAIPFAAYIYLPVFWDLQLTSVFEYLEHRFNNKIRILGSIIYSVQMTIYMAIATYAPCLALAQITPLTVYTSVSVMIVVCVFYTTLGGIKAVLWADVVQGVMMFSCILLVYIKGTIDIGGIENVWQKNVAGGKATLVDWDPNPTTRHTFWTLVIAPIFFSLYAWGINQTQVQRYLCLKKKSSAILSIFVGVTFATALVATCCYGGLVIYAHYGDCDPEQTGRITKNDQLFPLFAMDILGDYPGLPGLLIAGIFSAALSTVSSGINSLTATALEDYTRKIFPNLSDEKAAVVSKGLSVGFGILTFGLIIVVERMGNIMEASVSLYGMLSGPQLGLFTLGMVFPWTNCIGAGIGTLAGLIMALWVGLSYRFAVATGQVTLPKQFSTLGCNFTVFSHLPSNTTNESPMNDVLPRDYYEQEDILSIYHLSYQWYTGFGFFVTVCVGLLVSLLTGATKYQDVNARLFTPVTRWLLRKKLTSDFGVKELGSETTKL